MPSSEGRLLPPPALCPCGPRLESVNWSVSTNADATCVDGAGAGALLYAERRTRLITGRSVELWTGFLREDDAPPPLTDLVAGDAFCVTVIQGEEPLQEADIILTLPAYNACLDLFNNPTQAETYTAEGIPKLPLN